MNSITGYLKCIFIEVKTPSKKCKNRLTIGVVHRSTNTNITAFTNHINDIMQVQLYSKLRTNSVTLWATSTLIYDSHIDTQDYVDTVFEH